MQNNSFLMAFSYTVWVEILHPLLSHIFPPTRPTCTLWCPVSPFCFHNIYVLLPSSTLFLKASNFNLPYAPLEYPCIYTPT